MKYQLEVSDCKLIDVNNFCMANDLELNVDTMTITLSEIYSDGR